VGEIRYTVLSDSVPGTLKQVIIFETPAYVDYFGDTKGEPDQWELTVLGDNIAKLGVAPSYIGKRAKINVFINSKRFVTKDNKIIYPVNLILNKIELATEKAPAV